MERLSRPAPTRSRQEARPRVAAGERDRREGRDAAPADQPQQVAEAPAQQLERPPRGRADRGEQQAEDQRAEDASALWATRAGGALESQFSKFTRSLFRPLHSDPAMR